MMLINRLYFETIDSCPGFVLILFRFFFIILNELIVFAVLLSTNVGEEKSLGLVVNFSAAIIVCELDDIVMKTGRI